METPCLSAATIAVTGTDTGVGKTFASCALLRRARQQGLKVLGWKPVASGCESSAEGLRNEDALALRAAAGSELPYERINPYAFADPIAPHLAAGDAGVRIDRARLDAEHQQLSLEHELVLVEGAGGWQVPFDDTWRYADWVAQHQWPVLLVVAIRLGCINHALLTVESILRRAPMAGWIANCLPPKADRQKDNIDFLRRQIDAPLLGVLPATQDVNLAAQQFSEECIQALVRMR